MIKFFSVSFPLLNPIKQPLGNLVDISFQIICIDPAAIMFLIGSEMDYKEEKFSSGFDFNNPNEIARCGCGESFTVA